MKYEDLALRQEQGYFIFTFRCPKGFKEFGKYTQLELHIRTFISREMGWYTYLTTNTITNSLTVSFKAPFPVTGKQHLGRHPKEIENQQIGNAYYSAFTINEPVPVDSTVDWIFRKGTSG